MINDMNKQFELDKLYLKMAFIWAKNSYAIKRQVGCLIVKDRMIISDGYNGTPSGFENVCEDAICQKPNDPYCPGGLECFNCEFVKLKTKPYVLHAEANAITKLAKSSQTSTGATLYVTDEPCIECSKLIIQAGISRVVYCREYHSHQGLDLLQRAGISVSRISQEFVEDFL